MIEKLNINKTDMILRTIVKFLKVVSVIFCDFDFNIQEIRQITHLQYTSWPDHGTPNPLELLDFYRYVSKAMEQNSKEKLIVHCRFDFAYIFCFTVFLPWYRPFYYILNMNKLSIYDHMC